MIADSTSANPSFDMLVIGGGMVGAAFACAAARDGWRIAVIDGQPPAQGWPAGEIDLRVSALSRASQRILERLGVWPRCQALGVSPYREMVVWDAVGGAEIRFDSAALGEADLGHIVENRVTRLALWEALEQTPNVALCCPAAVAALKIDATGVQLHLADGRTLSARLVVGADGRESFLRQHLGIGTSGYEYDQRAIVAHVAVAYWHRETAWQRFLPTGPLAFLPLADGRCSIVWSARVDCAEALLALPDAAFIEALEAAFERRLGAVQGIGPRASFPLRRQHAHEYVRPRAALIGDAAHTLHPLAGQGVNLGLLDAAALVDALRHARAHGRDPGGLATLRRYARARRGDNALMLAAMDLFKRAFSNRQPPLVVGRNLGLAAANLLPPVKQLCMRQALGLGADLPTLARVG
ncbi:MAG: 2-octaprenyl-3-methyl-6-methoxy-1,4-benzoquinol hydroxylase [Chromatiaceae bacterium]|nr:MAG: 2-octaprenyl-3-methyl-6-methoxy-1,4-benzoquinol hydroxylase [Chromatiaceae bacterium]